MFKVIHYCYLIYLKAFMFEIESIIKKKKKRDETLLLAKSK